MIVNEVLTKQGNSVVKLMNPIVVTIEKTAEQKDITKRVRALANYNREKLIDSLLSTGAPHV